MSQKQTIIGTVPDEYSLYSVDSPAPRPIPPANMPVQSFIGAPPDELRGFTLQGLPPLPIPVIPNPDVAAMYPFKNQTVYQTACDGGLLKFYGLVPNWITVNSDATGLNVPAGIFVGTTQAEANANAQTALNDFINQSIASGNLYCDWIYPSFASYQDIAGHWQNVPNCYDGNFNTEAYCQYNNDDLLLYTPYSRPVLASRIRICAVNDYPGGLGTTPDPLSAKITIQSSEFPSGELLPNTSSIPVGFDIHGNPAPTTIPFAGIRNVVSIYIEWLNLQPTYGANLYEIQLG